jgi:hypothetical protein
MKRQFLSAGGTSPITRIFQACDPLKFKQFEKLHQMKFKDSKNVDLFLIDCEGLNVTEHDKNRISKDEEEKRVLLRKAMFVLFQLSNLIILVMREMITFENIDNFHSLFGVLKLIRGRINQFESESIIMMRDIDIAFESENFNEVNQKRRRKDLRYKSDIISLLNDRKVDFTEKNPYFFVSTRFF